MRPALCAVFIVAFCAVSAHGQPDNLEPIGTLPEFTLTDQEGNPFGRENCADKWTVLYFFFSTCTGPCPILNQNLAELAPKFLEYPEVQFVGVTVDPETDTPERLAAYGERHGAVNTQWRFLTGPIETVNTIATALKVKAADQPVFHSTRFILIDPSGNARDFFDGKDDASVLGLESALAGITGKKTGPQGPKAATLPMVNALLNAIAACFLCAGWIAIHGLHSEELHKRMMLAALVASAAFLACYLVYHAQAGSVPYHRTGLLRVVYFAILIPHIILATVMVPFILAAVYYAFRGRFDIHTRITRWVWPVWMYVSITGVIIYLMLYHG
jgi:protein SCO1/2/putative membrane protein